MVLNWCIQIVHYSNITCNTNTNGKYKSGSLCFVSDSKSTLGIIWRPSSAATKYVYKTSVTTYDWIIDWNFVSKKNTIDLPECKQVERIRCHNQLLRLVYVWTHTVHSKNFVQCSRMLSIPVFGLSWRYSPPTMASKI